MLSVDFSTSNVLSTSSVQSGLTLNERSDDHLIPHNELLDKQNNRLNYQFRPQAIQEPSGQPGTKCSKLQGPLSKSREMGSKDTNKQGQSSTIDSANCFISSVNFENALTQVQVNNTSGRRYYQGLKSKQIRELRRMCRKTANRSQYEKRSVQLRQVSTIECLAVSAIPFLASGESALRIWMKEHREKGAEWTDEFPLDEQSQHELRQWDQMLHNLVARITVMNNSNRTPRDNQQRSRNTRYMAVGVVPGNSKFVYTGNRATGGNRSAYDPNADGYSVVCVEDDLEANASQGDTLATYSVDVSGPPPFSHHVDITKLPNPAETNEWNRHIKPSVQLAEGNLATEVLSPQFENVQNGVNSLTHFNGTETEPEGNTVPKRCNLSTIHSHQQSHIYETSSQSQNPTVSRPETESALRLGSSSRLNSGSSSGSGSWSIVSSGSPPLEATSLEAARNLMIDQIGSICLQTLDPALFGSMLSSLDVIDETMLAQEKPGRDAEMQPSYMLQRCRNDGNCHGHNFGMDGFQTISSPTVMDSISTSEFSSNIGNNIGGQSAALFGKEPILAKQQDTCNSEYGLIPDEQLSTGLWRKSISSVDFEQKPNRPSAACNNTGEQKKFKSRFPLAPRTPVSIPISYEPNPFDPSFAHDQEEVQPRPDLTDSRSYQLFGPSFMEKHEECP